MIWARIYRTRLLHELNTGVMPANLLLGRKERDELYNWVFGELDESALKKPINPPRIILNMTIHYVDEDEHLTVY